MALVTSRTANWRLFGGGGLIVGAILWALHIVLVQAKVLVLGPWLFVIALLVIAVALVLVGFGETGSNGAVGNYGVGKAALVAFAVGFLLFAVNAAAALNGVVRDVVGVIAAILLIVGGLVSAYAIYRKGVAKGAARVILFVPAVLAALWAIGASLVPALSLWGIALALAILLAITGVLYLLNSRRIG
jgi:hypothetical protein